MHDPGAVSFQLDAESMYAERARTRPVTIGVARKLNQGPPVRSRHSAAGIFALLFGRLKATKRQAQSPSIDQIGIIPIARAAWQQRKKRRQPRLIDWTAQ